jgi:quercetin dioxygenase-like cupin family protein
MRPDIAPGAIFPDYQLPDHTSTPRRLSELQGDDPLILTLARGHYCPKEHQQHLELAAFYPKIAVAYTQVATISTDDHHTLQEFRASVGAQWPFLSDPDRTVVGRRPLARPARRDQRDPPRLGPEHPWPPRGLGRGRPLALPRVEQAAGSETGRGVTGGGTMTANHERGFSSATINAPLAALVAASLWLLQAAGATAQAADPAELRWSVPPVLPPGALFAVVSGDPTAPGEFTLMVSMPNGYRIPPHFHPSYEHVEVREGTLLVGMGDVLDPKRTQELAAGDSATAPAGMHHFSIAMGRTVVSATFIGPYTITYLHAEDAPRPRLFPFGY